MLNTPGTPPGSQRLHPESQYHNSIKNPQDPGYAPRIKIAARRSAHGIISQAPYSFGIRLYLQHHSIIVASLAGAKRDDGTGSEKRWMEALAP